MRKEVKTLDFESEMVGYDSKLKEPRPEVFSTSRLLHHARESGHMAQEGKYSKTLKVRIDPELLERVKEESKKQHTDVSTYVRWCIQTGLYLEDLNSFVRSKSGETAN